MNRERVLIIVSLLLALGALGLSVYLLIQSFSVSAIAGCGADSGCGQVLASRWAKAGPIPVSLLGTLTYLAALIGLLLRWNPQRKPQLAAAILWLTATLLLIGAMWFTYLQTAEIDALCPYCMACHLIGFVLAILLIILAAQEPSVSPMPSVVVGIAAGLALVVIQLNVTSDTVTQRAPNPFADQDGDTWIDDARYISLFGGELQFVLQDVPYIGDPTADHVVAVVFDYACPYCRTLHNMLDEAIEEDPSRFVLVPIPVSIWESHNPYIGSDDQRFEHSSERAILSMAVGSADREKWKQFDRWMFNADGSSSFPSDRAQARFKAERLIGNVALNDQLADENLAKHEAELKRNIGLLRLLPEDKRFIPITTTPGAPEHLTTRFDDIEVLYEFLESAKNESQ